MRVLLTFLFVFSTLLLGQENQSHSQGQVAEKVRPKTHSEEPQAKLRFCAAIRGNGENIYAHFGALARLTESYGVIDAMAGGSSGSITPFLYESILMNPAVSKCGKGPCSPKERSRRVALLLKSLEEYLTALTNTDEAKALKFLGDVLSDAQKGNVEALLKAGRLEEAARKLTTILNSKELVSLVNPEVFQMLAGGKVQEVYKLISQFGNWETKTPMILFRPGLVNFKQFPELIGRVADFYAGRGPADKKGMRAFLDKCATKKNVGRLWEEITSDPEDACRPLFNGLVKSYREKYDPKGDFRHRSQDLIGKKMPVAVTTSILEGKDMVDLWKKNFAEFWKSPEPKFDFKFPFDRVRFGYWGRPADLKRVEQGLKNEDDLKSQKFLALGPAGTSGPGWTKWEQALRTSPAEPGITNIQVIDENRLSAGGWSDLHPVQVLRAMGCENVVYLTRRTGEASFATGVARLLNISPEEERKLYSLEKNDGRPPSSYLKAIQTADGVWCTDWNKYTPATLKEMIKDSYRSPLLSEKPFFKDAIGPRPAKVIPKTDIEGCS